MNSQNHNASPPTVKQIKVACPLCGADDYRLRFRATAEPERFLNPEIFRCTSHQLADHGPIVQCNICHMVYNNPQPDSSDLEKLYSNVEDPLYLEESEARDRTFRRSLKQLHRFRKPPGKLLDVGCYTAAFMKVAKEEGWTTSGLELSRWASDIAKNAGVGTVYNVPLSQLPLTEASFEVITLWDVIEHLSEPSQILKDIHRNLIPGGILALSTHMVDSMAVKILGTRYPFFMDMHIVHFSRQTIKELLSKQGFQLLAIKPHRRILKTGYFLEKLSHKIPIGKKIVKYLSQRPWLARRFIPIGLLGLVNIYAVKTTNLTDQNAML